MNVLTVCKIIWKQDAINYFAKTSNNYYFMIINVLKKIVA